MTRFRFRSRQGALGCLFALVLLPLTACSQRQHPIYVASVRADTYKGQKLSGAVFKYQGDGGVGIMIGNEAPTKLCVAPPPQSAITIANILKHKGKVDIVDEVGFENSWSNSTTETLAKLYEQSQNNLSLQFALYRLCEAYANKMLGEGTKDCAPLATRSKDSLALANTAITSLSTQQGTLEQNKLALNQAQIALKAKPNDVPLAQAVAHAQGVVSAQEAKVRTFEGAVKFTSRIAEDDADAHRGCLQGRTPYDLRFAHVLNIASDMQKFEMEKAKAEAEKAKADKDTADIKAKAEIAKAKAEADVKELGERRKKALDVLIATKDKAKVSEEVVKFAVECKGECPKKEEPGAGAGGIQ